MERNPMTTHMFTIRPTAASRPRVRSVEAGRRPGRVVAVEVPGTPLLARALPHVTWSDAYAVSLPAGHHADPHAWAGAVFRGPPPWLRLLFGLREIAVRAVGIEPADGHTFDTVDWRPDEVLLGSDQRHLDFRASVLVTRDRLVVSTVVDVHNRRGRAYSAVVRPLHPFVVRRLLARAARTMGAGA
jgi:hypothetical protein